MIVACQRQIIKATIYQPPRISNREADYEMGFRFGIAVRHGLRYQHRNPLRAYGHAARVEFAGEGGDPLP